MADAAVENILATNLKARIIALNTSRFHRGNVLILPTFEDPPATFPDVMVQIRFPDVYAWGQAGWCYLQRFTFDIGVFARLSADPKKEWQGVLTNLNEVLLLVRRQVNNYDGGTASLHIRLFDSHQTMTPRLLTTKNREGETKLIKDCMWSSFRVWGMRGSSVENFVDGT